MARVTLETLAWARSGDKGDSSNIGVVGRSVEAYAWLREHLDAAWLKGVLGGIVRGKVERYELSNIRALNFILHDSLGGGGSASLLTDAQGKTHAQALLRTVVDVPDELLASLSAAANSPAPSRG